MVFRHAIGILTFLAFCLVGIALAEDAELSPSEGIDRYEQLVRLYPQKAPYQNALGYYHLKAGNYQEAETHLRKAVELDGSYAVAYNNLGIVYLRQRKPKLAEEQFRDALRLKPDYSKAQYNLAVALFHQKQYDKAAEAYLKVRELDKEYVERRDRWENVQQAMKKMTEDDRSFGEIRRMKQWFAPSY